MKKKMTTIIKGIFAYLVFSSSIGIYISVSSAARKLTEYGIKMANLRSLSGTSIAEKYYQLHGEVYACLGQIIENTSGVFLIAGFITTFLIIRSMIDQHKKQELCTPSEHH